MRRKMLVVILLLLSTSLVANIAVAREEKLPIPNGHKIYLPLIMGSYVCSGEGEIISLSDPAQVCCPGLDTIEAAEPLPGGGCMSTADMAVCTYCGDGACGSGENLCNCPADC